MQLHIFTNLIFLELGFFVNVVRVHSEQKQLTNQLAMLCNRLLRWLVGINQLLGLKWNNMQLVFTMQMAQEASR